MKQLIIGDEPLTKLKKLLSIKEFIEFLGPYYPNLNIKDYSIEEIERALYHTLIKLIGKIILISPQSLRGFLKDFLLKYEIMNIKQIILGTIVGMSKNEKSENVNFLVEEYLENTDFVRELLALPSLDEIQLFMRNTKYNKAVREGILYFKNNNEIFVLEAFLDQLYYLNLINKRNQLKKKEKQIISLYIDCVTEIYNLNMLYRGINNNIDRKLLAQFLIENYLFLDKQQIHTLLNQEDINKFLDKVEEILMQIGGLNYPLELFGPIKDHFYQWIELIYINYYFSKFKTKIDDIDYSTIFKIIEVIIKKQKEIQHHILPNVVTIIHDKYQMLERNPK